MSDKIWLVKQLIADSYEGFTSDYETVSVHKTEEGAKKVAADLLKDNAVYGITGGNVEDHEASPDEIVGGAENYSAEIGEQLRREAAVPGAVFMDVIFKILDEHGLGYADTKVTSQVLQD